MSRLTCLEFIGVLLRHERGKELRRIREVDPIIELLEQDFRGLFNSKPKPNCSTGKMKPLDLMYGCVTNGYDWNFMRLQNKQLETDGTRFFLNEIARILGVFALIVGEYDVLDGI